MEYIPTWERDAHKTGEKRGEKRGIEKGSIKEKIRTAKVMIGKGFDIDTIIDITGLDKKEIEKLSSKSH
jgi:predicted transposase/invertase (TIGR01784 family)